MHENDGQFLNSEITVVGKDAMRKKVQCPRQFHAGESTAGNYKGEEFSSDSWILFSIRSLKVELGYVDQGYTGAAAESAAARHGIQLKVVKHTEAKRGFVLLPRRWVVGRSFAWAARFRRLARDYERLSQTLAAFHYFAFACLMLGRIFKMLT